LRHIFEDIEERNPTNANAMIVRKVLLTDNRFADIENYIKIQFNLTFDLKNCLKKIISNIEY
jgi:hypothetical protein